MRYFLSFLERYSFVKILSITFVFITLLTRLAYAQEPTTSITLDSFSQNSSEDISSTIFAPKTIKLIYANEETILLAYDEYVKDVLSTYEISYSENDIVFPTLDYEIKNTNFIKIVLVNKNLTTVIEEIPFEIERFADKGLPYGTEITEQEGKIGRVQATYVEIFENGEHITTEIQNREVLELPINTIIRVGSQTTAIGGSNCSHWFNIVDQNTSDEKERAILKSLISCESRCNDAKNNSNTYLGLLQFNKNTFLNYGGSDIWSGEQQIVAAINILRARGLSHHWPACSRNID